MQDANRTAIDRRIRTLIRWLAVASEYCYRAQAVPVWTSADGRVIPVTEMDEVHLQNAIGVLERRAPHAGRRAWILPALYAERERRRVNNAWSQARWPGKPKHDVSSLLDENMLLARNIDGLIRRVAALEHARTVSVDMLRRGLVAAIDAPGPGLPRFRAMRRAMGL